MTQEKEKIQRDDTFEIVEGGFGMRFINSKGKKTNVFEISKFDYRSFKKVEDFIKILETLKFKKRK